jgi:DNA-directed RNA polymerase specialized sigma24 family protein
MIEEIDRFIRELGKIYHDVFVLILDNYPYKYISAKLDINLNTLNQRIYKIRQEVRRRFADRFQDIYLFPKAS